MKRFTYLLGGLLLLLSGCDTRREILGDESVWVRVHLDWKNADARPNGATVWFFPHRADLSPVALRTHETVDSIRLRMDNYSVLVLNETEKDHGGMFFRGIDCYETFEAYSAPVPQRNAAPVVIDGEALVLPPDPLLMDKQDNLDIPMNMIQAEQRPLLKFVPQQMLYSLQLSVRIQGLDNVLPSASAATLSGLAGGRLLTSGDYSPERVTQQFGFNKIVWDPGSYQKGTLYARFLLFGIDGVASRQVGANNKLKLYLKLRDGSIFTLERSVGDLISKGSGSELALELHIGLGETDKDPIVVVPDVPDKNPGADSGFDADVDDWGDEVVIEIPVQ